MPVLIIDSSNAVIDRIKESILESDSNGLIYSTTKIEEAQELVSAIAFSNIVIDSNFPDKQSVEFVKNAKRINESVNLIVLSIEGQQQIREKFMLAGADYFLDKYSEVERIPAIVNLNTPVK